MADRTGGLPVALIGMRCAGKSSVGRRLAELLARPFLDLDLELVRAADSGRTPGEILRRGGVEAFRALESRVLERVLEGVLTSPGRLDRTGGAVLATGGGVVEHPQNRRLLAGSAVCVWLDVPAEVLRERLALQTERMDERPPLLGEDPLGEIPRLLALRSPLYRGLATHVLDAAHGGIDELAAKIHATLTGEGE